MSVFRSHQAPSRDELMEKWQECRKLAKALWSDLERRDAFSQAVTHGRIEHGVRRFESELEACWDLARHMIPFEDRGYRSKHTPRLERLVRDYEAWANALAAENCPPIIVPFPPQAPPDDHDDEAALVRYEQDLSAWRVEADDARSRLDANLKELQRSLNKGGPGVGDYELVKLYVRIRQVLAESPVRVVTIREQFREAVRKMSIRKRLFLGLLALALASLLVYLAVGLISMMLWPVQLGLWPVSDPLDPVAFVIRIRPTLMCAS